MSLNSPPTEVDEDSSRGVIPKENDEEEESSTAVTSSTVTVDPQPIKAAISSPESDSDSDTTLGTDLESRLAALDVPKEVTDLARRLANQNARLIRHRRRDAREISRLRSQLASQQIEFNGKDEGKSNEVNDNANAADSTEGSEEAEASQPLNNVKDLDDPVAAGND